MEKPNTILAGGELVDIPPCGCKYGTKELRLYHHPELLVPENINLWERDYLYSGAYYAATPYLERHPCAIEAMEIYNNATKVFEANNGK